MIWREHFDLPTAVEHRLPRLVTESIVAMAGIFVAVGLRLALQQLFGNTVPYSLTFPAITAVVLIAGARAGLMTLVGCQLLIWYHVLPPHRSFAIHDITTAANLVLVTLAQLVMLWAVSAYRNAMRGSMNARQVEIDSLSMALREIDHRTRNNFQLAIALLTLQARGAHEPDVRAGLERAAARLHAIASVYRNLALAAASLEEIRLHDHLGELCDSLREGLLPQSIQLEFAADPVVVPHELAIRVGLIVNELVTNAAKHAFPDGVGKILVTLKKMDGDAFEVAVSDDGKGMAGGSDGTGLGSKLIRMLVRQIDAEEAAGAEQGTCRRFRIPLPGPTCASDGAPS